MSRLHGSPIWYELMTPDADAARTFYRAVLGWEIDPGQGDRGYAMIRAHDGAVGGLLPLSREMCDHGARAGWLMYLGVDDVDAAVTAITAAGGQLSLPPWDIAQGRIALVADPQGAPFYVMTPIPPAGGGASEAFSPTLPGHCSWNELSAADPDAAIAFYGETFGWTVAGSMPMGAMGDYRFLAHDGLTIGAAMRAPDTPPRHWLHYFRVPAIDAAIAAVAAAGGTIEHGPHDVPGGDRVVIARDPAGAGVGLVARA